MTDGEIREAAHLFAARICSFDTLSMGSLLTYLGAIMTARTREDVEDFCEIRKAVAELLAPEIIGDIQEGPPA